MFVTHSAGLTNWEYVAVTVLVSKRETQALHLSGGFDMLVKLS
jgi:hypothetical protein